MNSNNHYDVIIIGSGFGGLTAGSLLAQVAGKRVLILERHFKLGGFTHSFRRHDWEWDVGVHYIGEMAPKSMSRRLMDLVTAGGVQWHKLDSPVEQFIFPEGVVESPDDPDVFREQLIARFPHDAANIRRYFKDVNKAKAWFQRWLTFKQYPPKLREWVCGFGKELATMTTADYMSRFKDPLLRAALSAQWPDFGTPPDSSAFTFHSVITTHYFHGAYYPIGGAKELAIHAAKPILDKGGACLVGHEVVSINVKDGKVSGVTALRKGKEIEFTAPVVISNAGAPITFSKLLDQQYGQIERERLARIKSGPSALILFLGLNDDPRKYGFRDCNYWMFRDLSHDAELKYREGEPYRMDGGFLSFGSLRNPGQTPHTAQIITVAKEDEFRKYAEKSWKRRGDDYEALKTSIADHMLDTTEQYCPGVKQLVAYKELSTPLTIKSFTDQPRGMIYGQACDRNRLERDSWPIVTSVPNLYLTGTDIALPGVDATMFAGLMTAGKVLGRLGMPRLMRKIYSR